MTSQEQAASRSQRLARVQHARTTRLTHIGRKSGKPYEVTIWFTVDGADITLYTQNRKRQWIQNVLANPRVTLRIAGETFEGRLQPITEPEEMARAVQRMKKKYPISIPYLWIKKKPDGAFRVELGGEEKAE